MNHIKLIQQNYKTKNVSSTDIGLNCPFCLTVDKGNNLWVSHKSPDGYKHPQYHCWRCGESGPVYKLLKLLNILTDSSEVELYDNSKEPSLFEEAQKVFDSTTIALPIDYIALSEDTKSLIGKKALDYLLKRNIDFDKIKKYRLGYCSTGKYANRIIIPMYDEYDNLIYFTARSFYSAVDCKTLFPKENLEVFIGKSDILYNINNNIDKDIVILNEGPFDAMTTDGIGFLGKHPSPKQLNNIKKLKAKTVILMLDSDAIEYNYAIAKELYNYKTVYICELPYGDPNSIDKKDLATALNTKIKFNDFEYLNFRLRSKNGKMPRIKM